MWFLRWLADNVGGAIVGIAVGAVVAALLARSKQFRQAWLTPTLYGLAVVALGLLLLAASQLSVTTERVNAYLGRQEPTDPEKIGPSLREWIYEYGYTLSTADLADSEELHYIVRNLQGMPVEITRSKKQPLNRSLRFTVKVTPPLDQLALLSESHHNKIASLVTLELSRQRLGYSFHAKAPRLQQITVEKYLPITRSLTAKEFALTMFDVTSAATSINVLVLDYFNANVKAPNKSP